MNYYLEKTCPHCRHTERKHLGKSSQGWAFLLHVSPEDGISSLEDVMALVAAFGAPIRDEYGDEVTTDQFLNVVTNRHSTRDMPPTNKTLDSNEAVYEPETGLLRTRIGPYCLGHGPGTWDLIPGEFS